jgi:hypothetical protein
MTSPAGGTAPLAGNTGDTTMEIEKHVLDEDEIDELDEISGDEQLSLVWCITHQKYEWHWLERSSE